MFTNKQEKNLRPKRPKFDLKPLSILLTSDTFHKVEDFNFMETDSESASENGGKIPPGRRFHHVKTVK